MKSSCSFLNIAANPLEPTRRAIAAASYIWKICKSSSFLEDAARIMASLNCGGAVQAYRIVGPSDYCIITNYDEDGRRSMVLDTLCCAIHLMHTANLSPKVIGLEGLRGWADEIVSDDELLDWQYLSVTVQIIMLRDHCQAETFLLHALADLLSTISKVLMDV